MTPQPLAESFAGLPYHHQPFAGLPEHLQPSNLPPASAVRASVERGDPLALYQRLAMSDQIETRQRIHSSHLAPLAAATHEAVAVDCADLAAGQVGEGPFSAGEDSAAMEHERQSRLSRWQAIGSQR